MYREAELYEALEEKSVKCTACPHYCIIREGLSGACGVRKNKGGKLYLLAYGAPATLAVDPLEKKPLFHFLPGQHVLSLGTLGCNFGCDFCQNWDISQAMKLARVEKKKEFKEEEFFQPTWPPEKLAEYAATQRIPAIAFTYNEPTILYEYALDTFKLARKNNIKTIYVSNGFASLEAVEGISKWLDAINVDLKSFNDAFYRKVCKGRLKPVLEAIRLYHEKGVWVEVTTLVIPGQNDSQEELGRIAEFIDSVNPQIPWHVTAFHPDYKMASRTSTPAKTLLKARDIGFAAGLDYVYVGNVLHSEAESTYCPSCKKLLIERRGFFVSLKDFSGTCSCGEKIAGVWS